MWRSVNTVVFRMSAPSQAPAPKPRWWDAMRLHLGVCLSSTLRSSGHAVENSMRKLALTIAAALVVGGCTSETEIAQEASFSGGKPQITPTGLPHNPRVQTGRTVAFASLPDRGTLLAFDPGQKPVQRGASTYHAVRLSEAHALNAAVAGKSIDLPLPSGETMRIAYQRHEEALDGNWSWIGKTKDGLDAVITFGEGAVFGRIYQKGTEAYSLTMSGGRSWLVQTDPTKLLDGNLGRDADETDVLIPPSVAAAASARKSSAAAAVQGGGKASAANTVDVVLGYTNGLVTKYGSAANATTRLSNLMAITNQGYVNSQITPRVRLVRTVQVNYTDTNSNETALEALTGFDCNATTCTPLTVPTELVPLRTARTEYGADLVSLVRPFQAPQHQGCGIAWLLGGGGFPIDSSDEPFGYSIVSDGNDTDEGDGRNYFCREETLAHELGHNMGQQHNVEDAGSPVVPGTHPYSYGYREAITDGFYTVMAYRLPNSIQFSINYFGNPSVNYPSSPARPTGSANADNARSMNISMPLVAQFRSAVVPFGTPVANDYDGDGKSDIYWRNISTGNNDLWKMNATTLSSSTAVYREANLSWTVVGSGDFNGDSRSDILWRNTSTGQVYIQHMQGSTILASSGSAPTVASAAWQIVALADFNGDGKSDIYWRNSSTGQNDLWLMGTGTSPTTATTVYNEPNQAWKVRGAGDFNGDGRADLFWRNDTTGRNFIQFMNGTSVLASSGYTADVVDQAWQVVAISDFDADGRSDLYWRNGSTGANHLWTMNGVQIKAFFPVYNEPNQNWQIVNSGDYNGDGFADVVWRNSATGQNYMHLMQGGTILASSGSLVTVADQNWRMIGLRGSN